MFGCIHAHRHSSVMERDSKKDAIVVFYVVVFKVCIKCSSFTWLFFHATSVKRKKPINMNTATNKSCPQHWQSDLEWLKPRFNTHDRTSKSEPAILNSMTIPFLEGLQASLNFDTWPSKVHRFDNFNVLVFKSQAQWLDLYGPSRWKW